MAKSRALDKRRKSIKSIRKITRTMELVATAQFKKAMEKAIAADSYTKRLVDLVHDLTKSNDQFAHPLLVERKQSKEQKDVTLLVLSANRGMCGGFNAGVMRFAVQRLKDFQRDYSGIGLDVSGKRGISSFKFRGLNIENAYIHLQDKPTLDKVTELADKYLEDFITDKIDRLDICYTKFESLSRQYAVVETLLPIVELTSEGDVNSLRDNPEYSDVSLKRAALMKQADELTADRDNNKINDLAKRNTTMFEFLPSPQSVLEELIPKAFKA
ncbi:MAG: F0F1 ATP synthase subunit gamma, partial [Planctomycetaceae bacterium]|nr:F0F1 ATP synthase subunit gamma [Planctomycetaceae bacterium]